MFIIDTFLRFKRTCNFVNVQKKIFNLKAHDHVMDTKNKNSI